jgi:D-sedoheptulose 7-phosphate isomerase
VSARLERKAREGAALALDVIATQGAELSRCAAALGQRFERGGRLFTMGNGGSACDAEHAAVEFMHPILEKRRPLPAHALAGSTALVTAIGNDRDFSRLFIEQIELFGSEDDAVLGVSTSGVSANVNRALAGARAHGLLTIGFAGRDGGKMVELCDHCFVVPSWSIHRVQEVHCLLLHLLWDETHVLGGADDVL